MQPQQYSVRHIVTACCPPCNSSPFSTPQHHTLDLNFRLEQQLMEVKQLAAEQLAAAEAQVQDDQQVSPWGQKSGFHAASMMLDTRGRYQVVLHDGCVCVCVSAH